jgi:pantetheine-phosphate adenylyltransferase
MKKIAFSGTLDPITNGHMWVIGEALAIADEVIVFLSENPLKKPRFPADMRKKIIERSVAERGWQRVQVVIVNGDYTARAAKKHGIDYLIRGIRNNADFDYENLIQQTNVDVLSGAKTIFVMPPRDLGSVSSSFVKALEGPVGWHWHMKKFVPKPAYEAWISGWLRDEWNALWPDASANDSAGAVPSAWFDVLTGDTCYGAGSRRYHNIEHLVHGLTELQVWAADAGAPPEALAALKKAFWFHDAVYKHGPAQVSNEEASAGMWLDSGLGMRSGDAQSVADLIRATDHFQESSITHPLKQVMLGADLAILGQDDDVYDAYAEGIRMEYGHVATEVYRAHRCTALAHLHGKAREGTLYRDAYFAGQYNDQAIANMGREIAALGGQL